MPSRPAAPPWHAAPRAAALVLVALAIAAGAARGAVVPLGAVATIELPPGAAVRPAGPAELARLQRERDAPRLIFAGTLPNAAPGSVAYEFHRSGRLPDPGPRIDPAIATALGRSPGFAGWRLAPTWVPARHALFWSYDVVVGGAPRTLGFGAFCTREGVLVLRRTSVPGPDAAAQMRAWHELLGRVTVLPGRRYDDARAGEPFAAAGVEALVAGRGVPPVGDARAASTRRPGGPAWISLRGGTSPARIAAATALFMFLAWLLARSARAFARLGVDMSGAVSAGPAAGAAGDALAPGELAGRLQRRVESLARVLEPGALAFGAEASGSVGLEMAIGFAVHFQAHTEEGTGRLGAHVRELDSAAAFRSALDGLLERTSAESAGRLDAWISAHGPDYRARLAEADVRSDPVWVGHAWTCETCSGRGRVTCHGCGGQRQVQCTGCYGRGSTTCSNCGGSAQTRCSSCGGAGYRYEQVSVSAWDSATNSNVTRWEQRQVNCFSCRGGYVTCGSCSNGRCTCWTCGGSGSVSCSTCGGAGTLACGTCGATGILHRAGVVRCRVDRAVTIGSPDGAAEDAETFRERFAFEALGDLAPIRFTSGERRGRQARLAYAARVPLRTLDVTARARTLQLRAYGEAGVVLHHHGLVEALLEPDAAELEDALRALPWWKRAATTVLLERLRVFFASELHVRLIEARGGMAEAVREIEQVVGTSLASAAYTGRATALADRCLGRLQSSSIEQAAVAWCSALALVFLAGRLLALGALAPGSLALGAVAAAVPAWFALEWVTRRRLRRMLTPELEKRVSARLGAARMRHRAIVAAFALGAWLLAALPDRL